MKIRRKATALIIFLAIFAGAFYYFSQISYQHPVHFKNALLDFEYNKNLSLFDIRKQQLQKYYLCGGYEQEVSKICQAAANYFSSLCVKDNALIIFDVDDTAVYHYQTMDKFEFTWMHCPALVKARQTDLGPAIKPVLELYKRLIEKRFKIIFLSSRNESDYDHTQKELITAGYTQFEKIILMPDKLAFDRSIKTADWKLSVRKELAKEYTIIGCVGDRGADFAGEYTGYSVKLPNYLY